MDGGSQSGAFTPDGDRLRAEHVGDGLAPGRRVGKAPCEADLPRGHRETLEAVVEVQDMAFHHGPAEGLGPEVRGAEAEMQGRGVGEVGGTLPLVPGENHAAPFPGGLRK